jgi:hypothetical protein
VAHQINQHEQEVVWNKLKSAYNEIRSQTFDITVWPLEGAKTHGSSVWVLLGKGRKGENKITIISVLKRRKY